jgi:hypothetical protein
VLPSEFGRQLGQSIRWSEAVLDSDIRALDVVVLLEAQAEGPQTVQHRVRRPIVENRDHRQRLLLRSCRKWPCRSTADNRY